MSTVNLDWPNIGFQYRTTSVRFVANYKDGKWDEGTYSTDPNVVINESAGVIQYAQTAFEGMKAYRTENGDIVCFRLTLTHSVLMKAVRDFVCLSFLRTNL